MSCLRQIGGVCAGCPGRAASRRGDEYSVVTHDWTGMMWGGMCTRQPGPTTDVLSVSVVSGAADRRAATTARVCDRPMRCTPLWVGGGGSCWAGDGWRLGRVHHLVTVSRNGSSPSTHQHTCFATAPKCCGLTSIHSCIHYHWLYRTQRCYDAAGAGRTTTRARPWREHARMERACTTGVHTG